MRKLLQATTVAYACAILVRDAKVLMGLRASHKRNFPNCWDLIGGHIEVGETPTEALVRELREELDIVPTGHELWRSIVEPEMDQTTLALWHLFLVRTWTPGEPRIANDEHVEIRWFGVEELDVLTPMASESYRSLFRVLGSP